MLRLLGLGGAVLVVGAMSAQTVSPPTAVVDPVFNAHPAFAVFSLKPSPDSEEDDWGMGLRGRHFWATHVTINELIGYAYGLSAVQIEHAPEWFDSERFDVDGLPDTEAKPTREQYKAMLQRALLERLAMKTHAARKVLPVYVLTVASGGLKLSPIDDTSGRQSFGVHQGWLQIKGMTFAGVAQIMQRTIFDRPVLDETGQRGLYSFTLRWRADETQFGQLQGVTVPEEEGMAEQADIFVSARQQLGVRIEPKKTEAPTLVVETASRPTPN